MNKNSKKIHDKFDALQQREKIMVAGLIFVLIYVAWQTLLFDHSAIASVKVKNQIKAQQQKNSAMQSEIAAYSDRINNNPNVKLKREQQQYLNQIKVLDNKLNKKMKGLISPKKMTVMLKELFESNKNLALISLEKLKTQSIFDFSQSTKSSDENIISVTDDVSNQDTNKKAVVYRHPVRIVFTGSYLNTMNYLEAIEKKPWDLYWDAVQLDVEKYPKSKIVITVFTLSFKKGWIGV